MTLKSGNITALVMAGLFYPVEGGGSCPPPVYVPAGTLDISPAVILREYIVFITLLQSPSGDSVWPCYIGSMPDGDEGDDCACVYDFAGSLESCMDGKPGQHYGVSLSVRSKDYQEGWNKINDISDQLDMALNAHIVYGGNTYLVQSISRNGSANIIGTEPDTKRRFLFNANFEMTVKQLV